MAKFFTTGIVVTGTDKGGVRVVQLTRKQIDALSQSQAKGQRATRSYAREFAAGTRQTSLFGNALRDLSGTVKTIGVGLVAREVVQLADQYDNINARLRIVTETQEEFNRAQRETFEIAQRTFADLQSTTELYSRLELSLGEVGVEQGRVLSLTETINQTMAVSGATAQEAGAAMIQLSQGLAAGALRGDEFRSVMEQAPRLAKAFADGLGVPIGKLRELSQQGKLTSEVLLQALETQASKISDEFAEIPLTVGRSITQFTNAATSFVGQANEATGVTRVLAGAISFVAENFSLVATLVLGFAGAKALTPLFVAIGRNITAIRQFGIGLVGLNARMAATQIASAGLTRGLALLGGPAGLAAIAAISLLSFGSSAFAASNDVDTLHNRVLQLTEDFDALRVKDAEALVTDLEASIEGLLSKEKLAQSGAFSFFELSESDQQDLAKLQADLEIATTRLKELEEQAAKTGSTINQELGGAFDDIIARLAKDVDPLRAISLQFQKTFKEINKQFEDNPDDVEGYNEAISLLTQSFAKQAAEAIKDIRGIKDLNAAQQELSDTYIELLRDIDPVAAITADYHREVKRLKDLLAKTGDEKTYAAALALLNRQYDEAIEGTKHYNQVLQELRNEGIDQAAAQLLQLKIAIEEATGELGDQHPVVLELISIYERLAEAQSKAGQSFDQPLSAGEFGKGLIGTFGNFALDVLDGADALGAFAGATSEVAHQLGQLDNPERFKNLSAGLSGISAGLAAGASGQSAGSAALSGALQGGLSGFASGGPIGAVIGAIAGAVSGFLAGAEDPRIRLVNTLVDPDSEFTRRSPLGVTVQAQRGTEGTPLSAILDAVQRFDVTLARIPGLLQQFGSEIFNALTPGGNSETFKEFEGAFTVEEILAHRFEQILSGLPNEFRSVIDATAHTLEQQLGALAASLQISDQVSRREDVFRGELALSEVFDTLVALALPGEELAETYTRLLIATENYRTALALVGEDIVGQSQHIAEIGSAVTEALGGVARSQGIFDQVFSTFFSEAELIQAQLQDARRRADELLTAAGLDTGTSSDEFRSELEAALSGGASPEQIAALFDAGAALATVIDLEAELAEIRGEAVGGIEAQRELAEFMAGINGELRALDQTAFQRALTDLASQFQDATQRATELGASTEDLAQVESLFLRRRQALIDQLRLDTQDIVAELYGVPLDEINARISEIQSRASSEFRQAGKDADNLFESIARGLERVRGFVDDLFLDSQLSPLKPRERLDEAERQFNISLSAAREGDLDAINSLPGIARTFLQEASGFFASGSDFNSIFDFVTQALRDLKAPTRESDDAAPVTSVATQFQAELHALERERERILREQEEQRRRELAGTLSQNIADLAASTGQSLIEVAGELGVSLRDLAGDLGINLNELTSATAGQLTELSRDLNIELTDLARSVGVDLGNLGNRQSLINQALGATVDGLPPEFRDQLVPFLQAITNATTEADARAAIAEAETAINALPPAIAAQLSPFFDNVDVGPELPFNAIDLQIEANRIAANSLNIAGQTLDVLKAMATANGVSTPNNNPIGPIPTSNSASIDRVLAELPDQIGQAIRQPLIDAFDKVANATDRQTRTLSKSRAKVKS